MIIGDVIAIERGSFVVKVRSDSPVQVPAGEFVGIRLADGTLVVGTVAGLINKVKDELLPYMGSQELPKLLPYVEDYCQNHIIVTGLGTIGPKGEAAHNMFAPVPLKSAVETLDDKVIASFHRLSGAYSAGYLFRLKDQISPETAVNMLSTLERVLPSEARTDLKAARRFFEDGGFQ
jgi:hypothetical protein